MFQLSLELTAPSFYLWEPPRRFLKEPYISAHNSVPVQKDHFSAHGNFYKRFSKVTFWGEIFYFKKVLNFLSFLGLLYVSGYFKQKGRDRMDLGVSLIKAIVTLFDYALYPFYLVIHRPWLVMKRRQKQRAWLSYLAKNRVLYKGVQVISEL